MQTIKTWFLIVGVVLCFLGFMCIPVGFGASPKRNLSLFSNFTDLGTFFQTGIVLLSAGMLVIALTMIISSFFHVFRRNATPQNKKKFP